MTQLTIIANIVANEDKVEVVKAELLKLIDTTRAEEGCINYDLHQDNENLRISLSTKTGHHANCGKRTWGILISLSTWLQPKVVWRRSLSMR